MAQSNAALSTKLAAAGAPMVPAAFESNVKHWYAQNRKRILALVGGTEDRAALFIASAFAQVNRLPELLNCTPESFFQCLIFSMGTNLLPGPMQECVFIPFKESDKDGGGSRQIATFVPMYQGLVKLVYNSGFVTRIGGHIVWEADAFEYDPAEEKIYHRPFIGAETDRGKRIGAYTTIKNRFGEVQPTFRSADFIEGIKGRSRGARSSFSPWNSRYDSDVDAMWLKTVFRQGIKWIPKAAKAEALQLGRALELDNQADTGEQTITASLLNEEPGDVQKALGTTAGSLPEPGGKGGGQE